MSNKSVGALILFMVFVMTVAIRPAAHAEEIVYAIQPGDILQISVWREPDMQLEVAVRPDGNFSMPLVGDIPAQGKSVQQLREDVSARLQKLMPDSSVNIVVKQALGNKVYVTGKVNRPGEYVLNRSVDVMQALSMAGGAAKFAKVQDILILRRNLQGQLAIPFNYAEVEEGLNLGQNIVLQSGDVVVVP